MFGALGAFAALIILLFFGGLAGIETLNGDPSSVEDVAVLSLIGGIGFIVVAIFSVPGLIAGIGLLNGYEWARILTLVLSALNLFNIPLGTALGIYGLWVLSKNETIELLKAKRVMG